MFFSDWRVLRRRWYAVLVGLLLTVGLCAAAAALVPVKYEATAEAVLLPPESSLDKGGNPYLALGGLSTVADILARSMTDASTIQQLEAVGVTDPYTVAQDPTTGAPVILITVTSDTAQSALTSMRAIVARVPDTLTGVQTSSGVSATSLIRSQVITEDKEATKIRKSQLRALLVAMAGGIVTTWLSTALLDSLLVRRRQALGKVEEVEAEPETEAEAHSEGRTPIPNAVMNQPTAAPADFDKLVFPQTPAPRATQVSREAIGHASQRDLG